MRIVFGWNYLILKSYKLSDLIVTDNESLKNADLVVREAYFHLFWIPFFSLGKRYHIRPDNSKKIYLKPTPDLIAQIDKKQLKTTKKWYAWILTLLICLGLLFLGAGWLVNEQTQNEFSNEVHRQTDHFIDNPKKGAQFSLIMNAAYLDCEVHQVDKANIWITIDYSKYTDYKLHRQTDSKSTGETITITDSLDKTHERQTELMKHSNFIDSLKSEYPDEELLRALIALDLEKLPKTYEVIKMPRKEFERLKSAHVDGVVLHSLKHITGSKVQISLN